MMVCEMNEKCINWDSLLKIVIHRFVLIFFRSIQRKLSDIISNLDRQFPINSDYFSSIFFNLQTFNPLFFIKFFRTLFVNKFQ